MKWAIREGNRPNRGRWLQTKSLSFLVANSFSCDRKDALKFQSKSEAFRVLADVLDDVGSARLIRLVPRPVPRGTLVLADEVLCMVVDSLRSREAEKPDWVYYLYRCDSSAYYGERHRKDFQKYREDGTVRRKDGKRVRLDRWESGIRSIATCVGFGNKEFEVDDIVRAVEELKSETKHF